MKKDIRLSEEELRRCRREKAEELAQCCSEAMAEEWDEDISELEDFRIRMFNYFYGQFERSFMTPEMMDAWIRSTIENGQSEYDDY